MGMGRGSAKRKPDSTSKINSVDATNQTRFSGMSEDDAFDFWADQRNVDWTGLNRWNDLQGLVAKLGMHEKPVVLEDNAWDQQFAAGNALDGVYLYRGVSSWDPSFTSADIVDQIKFGDKTFIGDGVHGDGIYFTTNYDYAYRYAAGEESGMAQAYIDKSKARVITEKDIRTMQRNDTTSASNMDINSYALYKGYNVIHVPGGNADGSHGVVGQGNSYRDANGKKRPGGEDYYVPLTRSVLVIRNTVKRR